MSRRVIGPLAALAVLTLGGVSGCSSDAPTPKPLSSSTPSPASSPSSSASPSALPGPPSLPAAARGHTDASARAFVRYWVAVLNYSAGSGDATTLRSLSSARCVACTAIADYIVKVHRAGGFIRGGRWSVTRTSVIERLSSGALVVDGLVVSQRQSIRERPGARLQRYAGGTDHKKFSVAKRGTSWTVIYLRQPE